MKRFAKPEKNSGKKNLLLILDSNEYIFSLGAVRDPSSEKLFEKIVESSDKITLRIPRLILDEVRHNLTPEAFKELVILLNSLTKIDEDFEVPFELGVKYEEKGFKSADAFIAAYAEWTGAEMLITENRHNSNEIGRAHV